MKEWEAHSGLPLFLLLGHEGCAVAPPNGRIQRDFPLREMLHQEPFRKDWSHAHNTKSRQGKDTCGAGLPQAQAHVFVKAAFSPDKSTALTSPKQCFQLLKAVLRHTQSSPFTRQKLWFDTPKAALSPAQSNAFAKGNEPVSQLIDTRAPERGHRLQTDQPSLGSRRNRCS